MHIWEHVLLVQISALMLLYSEGRDKTSPDALAGVALSAIFGYNLLGIGHTDIWTLEANGCGDVDLTHTCLQQYSHIGHIGVTDHPYADT